LSAMARQYALKLKNSSWFLVTGFLLLVNGVILEC
jgi:hypothetical protein